MKKIIVMLSFIAFVSCGKDDNSSDDDNNSSDGFDRTTFLNAVVENNILPAYDDFEIKLTDLNTAIATFIDTPSETSLNNVRLAYVNGAKVWQHLEAFNLLLASETGYKEDINSYPVNTGEIETFINGTFGQAISEIDFTRTSKNASQGFPAIDYLINNGTDSEIITHFSTGDYSEEYKELLTLYIDRMVTLTAAIVENWNSNKASFIADNTNTLSSSFNLLINDYVFYTEQGFREPKVAFPAGVRDNVDANTVRVESYYSAENSKVFLEEASKAVQNIFTGTPYGTENTTTVGLNDYLDFLNIEVLVNNEDIALSSYIENTLFVNIDTSIAVLDDNLVAQIETDNSKMETAFNSIQELVVALKVNTLEAFSVDVDYVDSDGD